MPSGNREIMCCGARSWCKVIGWTQILLNAVCCVFAISVMVRLSRYPNAPMPEEWKTIDPAIISVTMMAVILVSSTIGIGFGALLVQGINQKKPSFLRTWELFASFGLIFVVVYIVRSMPFGVELVVRLLIEIAMYTFAIWVVFVARKEMESDLLHSSRPAAYFKNDRESLPKYDDVV